MNLYESPQIHEITGETLRPGGFELTQKAVSCCGLNKQSRVLDLGCGRGATLEYLFKEHSIKATGIDPSEKLLRIAKEKNPFAELISGKGDSLPFKEANFECVFAECTLSLMDELDKTLQEVFRVLDSRGWFVITDVYARNPSAIPLLENFSIHSCMRGIHTLPLLIKKLEEIGFEVILLEECTHFLRELMVKAIFSHGSMEAFWSKTVTSEHPRSCCSFEQNLRECKPGYFMLITQKGEKHGRSSATPI